MPKRKTRVRKKSLKPFFLILFLISAGMVAATGLYVKFAHADRVPASERRQDPADETLPLYTRTTRSHREYTAEPVQQAQTGPFLFTPALADGKLTFSKASVSVPDDEDPKIYVVNKFLENLNNPDLKDARLLSIDVHDGVANLFFNADIDHTMGTDDESTLLNGILTNLGQFPEVNSVLFFSQGKQMDTFGSVDLSEKQDVIRSASITNNKS